MERTPELFQQVNIDECLKLRADIVQVLQVFGHESKDSQSVKACFQLEEEESRSLVECGILKIDGEFVTELMISTVFETYSDGYFQRNQRYQIRGLQASTTESYTEHDSSGTQHVVCPEPEYEMDGEDREDWDEYFMEVVNQGHSHPLTRSDSHTVHSIIDRCTMETLVISGTS